MAIVQITNTTLKRNEMGGIPATVAVDVTDGAGIKFSNKSDGKILIIIENSGAAEGTATIEAGNGLQGVEDLVLTIGNGKKVGIVVESGKFVKMTGENRGLVVVKGSSADIKVAAIELP